MGSIITRGVAGNRFGVLASTIPFKEIMLRTIIVFILLTVASPFAYGSDVLELSAFAEHPDKVVRGCYDQAMAAAKKGRALCKKHGEDEWEICPQSRAIRVEPLKRCRLEVGNAQDRAAMLYLVGLLHQDLLLRRENGECPKFYRYREGRSICDYTNDHFDQLVREFPGSRYSDMAAFKRAGREYRYYECEGQVLCSIENEIAGWIYFLEVRPESPLADQATDKIVRSLGRIPGARLKPDWETPDGLLEDIENLNGIAAKLSSENREKLIDSMKTAKPILIKLKEANSRIVHDGR